MNIHTLYRPFLTYFRTKRMLQLWKTFELTPQTRVLDVGGSWLNWSMLPKQPELIIVNVYPSVEEGSYLYWVVGDGCQLPFPDQSFDLVYSNSVIEHLGTFENQKKFAQECMRVGKRCYIQTPNHSFPIEPHLLTPFIHWFPPKLRRALLRNFTLWGLVARPTQNECDRLIDEIRLLNESEMSSLFPNLNIWHEDFVGMVKSLIAVRL